MGKRIISQARGKGSHTYRVKRKAFKIKLKYPKKLEGEGEIIRLINSTGHTAPIAKVKYKEGVFFIPAFKGAYEGQKILFGGKLAKPGNIIQLKDLPIKTQIYNVESSPGDGGVFVKSAGNSCFIHKKVGDSIVILMSSKKEKKLHKNCRAIIGVVAGSGRLDKPVLKAGKKHFIKKSKGKLWPRTSAVKMNAIDHPFGSGRAKNPKSKIAKRNSPPGRKVGLLRPKRTGKKK